MSWQKAIILNPNEQVLHSWEGNCERHYKAVVKAFMGHKTVDSKETNRGTLVLTNQRLLWFDSWQSLAVSYRVAKTKGSQNIILYKKHFRTRSGFNERD